MRLFSRLQSSLSKNKILELIDVYSGFNPSPMSLKKLTDFGKYASKPKTELSLKTEIKSFEFLREELLVRLAAMTKEMHYLPDKLLKTSSVQLVNSWYLRSFTDITDYKSLNKIDEKVLNSFTKTLQNIVNRHADVVPTMSIGILQLQSSNEIDTKTEQSIQYFLDRFLMSRISIRMLINQHLLMFGEDMDASHPGQIGAIHTNCNVLSVLKDAYDNAKFLCDQYYLSSPKVNFVQKNTLDKDQDINFVYVPSHLYHMAFELYKNAMRATVEYHGHDCKEYPVIHTLIVKGQENLTIRISDFGGGIPLSKIPYAFKYLYSTAPKPSLESDVYTHQSSAPLAGFGYGLPLSRLYARYFNGDLSLASIDGHGTDAYIHLKTISSEANESLPIHNRSTVNNYRYNRDYEQSNDWTDNKRNYSA